MSADSLTVLEAAKRLKTSRSSVLRRMKEGSFPNLFRVQGVRGEEIRIPKKDVEALLRGGAPKVASKKVSKKTPTRLAKATTRPVKLKAPETAQKPPIPEAFGSSGDDEAKVLAIVARENARLEQALEERLATLTGDLSEKLRKILASLEGLQEVVRDSGSIPSGLGDSLAALSEEISSLENLLK